MRADRYYWSEIMDLFPETNWSVLTKATLSGDESGREALSQVFSKYKDPVDTVIRKKGVMEHRVEDVRQEFFMSLMAGGFFRRAESKRGRFRAFLLNALRNFLVDDIRRLKAQKRGSGLEHVDMRLANVEVPAEEGEFDLVWAEALYKSALNVIRENVIKKRGKDAWTALEGFLSKDSNLLSYAELAKILSTGIGGAKSEVSRMRSNFRAQLRTEVRLTVNSPHEVDEELRCLQETMIKAWGANDD
ncbi:MAG: RNA polymerase sigma factor [Akkermansiaceae bacterium]